MTSTAAIFPPASEIYAALSVASLVCGGVIWLLILWLDRRYMLKNAFYAQRRADEAEEKRRADEHAESEKVMQNAAEAWRKEVTQQLGALTEQVRRLESDQKQVQRPLNDIAGSVEKMAAGFASFQEEIARWRLDLAQRMAVVEDRQKRGGRHRGGGG